MVIATKKIRQTKIAELITQSKVYSQQELLDNLERFGIQVTQATLSRDLTELGVVKGPAGYELVHRAEPEHRERIDLKRVLREFLRSFESAGHLIILRTDPGHAHTVAVHIDRTLWPEVLGTIAGDDTIFVAVKKPNLAKKVMARIQQIIS